MSRIDSVNPVQFGGKLAPRCGGARSLAEITGQGIWFTDKLIIVIYSKQLYILE
ncbi:MAG: hypothetical protein ACI84O_000572 [Myxococcota bacterium]|jgi:hypothetical protein